MIFDLTIPLDEKAPVYPGVPKPKISSVLNIDRDGFNELLLTFPTHTGTHIDAPYHCIKNGKKLSDFEISYFIGEAIVFNCSGQKEIKLSKTDLAKIKKDDFVFLYSGHSEKYLADDYFADYPVISEKSAEQLAEKKIKIFGIDSPSPDKSPYKIHYIFLGKGIPIVENLYNLSEVAGKRFKCTIAPLKVQNADGAPCRVIGVAD